jgi:hypothetical protein
MKITLKRRLALLAGLLLLSLPVFAIGLQAAQALPTSAGTALAGTQGRGGVNAAPLTLALAGTQGRGGVNAAPLTLALAGTQGRGGVNAAPLTLALAGTQGRGGVNAAPLTTVSGTQAASTSTQPASSGMSSTTAWIAAVAVVGALLIGSWALVRRRRQRHALPICEVYPAGC